MCSEPSGLEYLLFSPKLGIVSESHDLFSSAVGIHVSLPLHFLIVRLLSAIGADGECLFCMSLGKSTSSLRCEVLLLLSIPVMFYQSLGLPADSSSCVRYYYRKLHLHLHQATELLNIRHLYGTVRTTNKCSNVSL